MDGRRVKIWHTGQKKTCARCNKTYDECGGKANARLCEENNGVKTKTEEMWKERLANVGYTDWDGLELNHVIVETGPDEEQNNELFKNCDGVIINNLVEEATAQEVLDLLKEGIPEMEMKNLRIQIQENPRSRLITGINQDIITSISKKLNKKLIGGQMIHCHPHVPSSPPEAKSEKAAENVASHKEGVTNVNKVNPEVKKAAVKPTIPGLPIEEMTKAQKKQRQKDKKQKEKEKLKEIQRKKTESKLLNSKSKGEAFLNSKSTPITTHCANSTISLDKSILVESPDNPNDFQFSDYEDDEFEDSKEIQSDDEQNFFTPINFKSSYAIKWTKLAPKSSSTPDLRKAGKRPAGSPTDPKMSKKLCGPSSWNISKRFAFTFIK